MSTLLATVIPAVLTFLVGYQGGLTRTSRLRNIIGGNLDLLDKLSADHPGRATLEAHNGELVELLVRRQRRRFEPFTRAGISFGANATVALMLSAVVTVLVLQAIGIWRLGSEPLTRGESWAAAGFYGAVGFCFAGFAFRAWRRQQQEHPAAPRFPPEGQDPREVGNGP
jgi:hypothetical protein